MPKSSIQQIFEKNVQDYPQHIALIAHEQKLTYYQLNQRANRLAHFLKKQIRTPELPIIVALPAGIDLIVTILAVLKMGCPYVPIDLTFPVARINFILQDCQASLLINQTFINTEANNIAQEDGENLNLPANHRDLAYICYTSGSTGQPKGVMIEHRGVIRLVKSTNYIKITPQDRIAQITNITFDVAAFEIWSALLNGATLVIGRAEVLRNAQQFAHFLYSQSISILVLAARVFDVMALAMPQMFASLTYLIVGCETVNPHTIDLVMRCQQGRPRYILNCYGPTENTVISTYYIIPKNFDVNVPIPIGKAISQTTLYVLDDQQQLITLPGKHGELYTGGSGLARGYLHQPQLNRERFINNPFSQSTEDKHLYRTGDTVYWREDGNLEYVGRRDFQVKIRGYRVELGTIESKLLNHALISQCIVLALPTIDYECTLCAFIVVHHPENFNLTELKQFLLQQLPNYMVPELFIKLETLPLNSSGKADREALIKLSQQYSMPKATNPPKTDTEKKLATIWSELLNINVINRDDSFLELGGHSLLLVRLQHKISRIFHQELSYTELSSALKLRAQAKLLENKTAGIVVLQAAPDTTPLFLLPPVSGECWCFFSLSQYLPRNQAVYALRYPNEHLHQLTFSSLEEMAASHIKDMQKIQARGPYQLAGYSFGANLAFAMVQQLIAIGETVSFLGLLDGWAKFPESYTTETAFRQRMLKLQQNHQADLINIDLAWQRMQLLLRYPLQPLPIKLSLFKAMDDSSFAPLQNAYNHWSPWAGQGIERYLVPGDHDTMLMEPQVQSLANILRETMAGANKNLLV